MPAIFPGNVRDFGVISPNISDFWLCSRIFIDERHPPLVLRLGRLCGDYEIFWNDMLLDRGSTYCGRSAVEAPAGYLEHVDVDLPEGLVNRRNLVMVRLFAPRDPSDQGITGGIPTVVDRRYLRRSETFSASLKFAFVFFMSGLSLIFLMSFLRHLESLDYLFVGLFLLTSAMWSFGVEGLEYYPGVLFQPGRRLEMVLVLFMVSSYAHFLVHFVKNVTYTISLIVLDAVAVAGIAAMTFAGSLVLTLPMTWLMLAWAVVYLAYTCASLLWEGWKTGVRVIRLVILTVLAAAISGFDAVNRQLYLMPDLLTKNLTLYGLVLLSLGITVIFMGRYRRLLVELDLDRHPEDHRP
ncbi:MAG: hypothetical protein HY042_09080 [Spirochaetia bacterium]|nr:hypothetical protein [Spirochaetia bacterium]